MIEYLLDTNAFFNALKALSKPEAYQTPSETSVITSLKNKNLYLSTITKVEIVSTLGKYARGGGGCEKCTRTISPQGDKCSNIFFQPKHKKMKGKRIHAFRKLIKDSTSGKGPIYFSLLPFDNETIEEAQRIIEHALILSFASMDALIAATASIANANGHNMIVVTSDHSLLACLARCNIPHWDAFSDNQPPVVQPTDCECVPVG